MESASHSILTVTMQSTISTLPFGNPVDANGNGTSLTDTNGSNVATYVYGPFGGTIESSGTLADENPFRFSTKYTDDETGLLYFGHRYYDPELGRWPSRDPKDESGFSRRLEAVGAVDGSWLYEDRGGKEDLLYTFVHNMSIDLIDPIGLARCGLSCGRDVKDRLMYAQADVFTAYFALPSISKKKANCKPFTFYWPYVLSDSTLKNRLANGWDLRNLTHSWDPHMTSPACAPTYPPPYYGMNLCHESVWVGKGCYRSWDVNYLLFGWINCVPSASVCACAGLVGVDWSP